MSSAEQAGRAKRNLTRHRKLRLIEQKIYPRSSFEMTLFYHHDPID
jgi:hypothetical protein